MTSSSINDPRSTDYFDYELPTERIAQVPIEPRDAARLLIATDDEVVHGHITDLAGCLGPGDVLVVNETKVSPARLLLAKETGGAVEVLLLEPTGEPRRWQALVRGGRRVRPGTSLFFDGEPLVIVHGELSDGRRQVELLVDDVMERVGRLPLPPYIRTELPDDTRYQTVFARQAGSVAAPTAGLHLTPELMRSIEARGVEIVRIELQVGLGTFRPITADVIGDHHMHSERYRVAEEDWRRIGDAQRVVAIGTTVVRTLEAVASSGVLSGRTDLFINRGYDWQVVDVLLTNFHVPRSSLLVLVDAFAGPRWRDLYTEALAAEYRFLSFGDAMLIDRRHAGSS